MEIGGVILIACLFIVACLADVKQALTDPAIDPPPPGQK
jgi:hypothetical protein